MQLYILGNNSDDKGTQLERLTCEILQNLGFSNIVTNEIGSGGHEIDVRAEYVLNSLNGVNKKPLICECKAYKNTVAMSDWLKFLGKILLEEHRGDIDGYFIALSGVNGNVSGNYRDLQTHRNNIKLIAGEELITQLNRLFQLVEINTIQKTIEKYTQRKPIEISHCYYNMVVYFLIGFSENEYSIISSRGELIKNNEIAQIKSLIGLCTSYQTFVDLEDESNSLIRFANVKKYIISFILLNNQAINSQEIKSLFEEQEQLIQSVNLDEIERALTTLIEKELVYNIGDGKYYLAMLKEDKRIDEVVKFYRYLYGYVTPILAIGCQEYMNNINEELLEEIQRIQGGVKIPDIYKEDCLKILKWSPSALFWSLTPDKMITNHRSNGKASYETIEEEDTSYFMQKLISLLSEDFKNKSLKEYFFKTCDFVELETNFRLKIKSKTQVELDVDYKDRLGLAQMTEEYKSQIIQVRIFNTWPEPWENNN